MKIPGDIEPYRIISGIRATPYGCDQGAFFIPYEPKQILLLVIASNQGGWDHISVSRYDEPEKIPTWEMMCHIKTIFFKPDEWAIQFHPPEKDNINMHQGCLHIWRPQNQNLPTPPKVFV